MHGQIKSIVTLDILCIETSYSLSKQQECTIIIIIVILLLLYILLISTTLVSVCFVLLLVLRTCHCLFFQDPSLFMYNNYNKYCYSSKLIGFNSNKNY